MAYLEFQKVKDHLRVDFDDDDDYISDLIDMAEEVVLHEIIGSKTGEGTVTTAGTTALVGNDDTNFADFQAGDTIKVDGETIRTIATITDDQNLTVTVAFTSSKEGISYVVYPGIPSPAPARIKHAMTMLVAHFYANREPVMVGIGAAKMPMGFDFLIGYNKNWTIA